MAGPLELQASPHPQPPTAGGGVGLLDRDLERPEANAGVPLDVEHLRAAHALLDLGHVLLGLGPGDDGQERGLPPQVDAGAGRDRPGPPRSALGDGGVDLVLVAHELQQAARPRWTRTWLASGSTRKASGSATARPPPARSRATASGQSTWRYGTRVPAPEAHRRDAEPVVSPSSFRRASSRWWRSSWTALVARLAVDVVDLGRVGGQVVELPEVHVAVEADELVAVGANPVVGPDVVPAVGELVVVVVDRLAPVGGGWAVEERAQRAPLHVLGDG